MKALAPFGIALTVGLAAAGFALSGGSAAAAPAGLAGAVPAVIVPAADGAPVEQANHRWRRGGPSIEFHFGGGPRYHGPRRHHGPRHYYGGPRFHQPRYAPPRYHRPAPVSAHVRWCSARYRSYRAWDNTFQPYNGPRRQCASPYF